MSSKNSGEGACGRDDPLPEPGGLLVGWQIAIGQQDVQRVPLRALDDTEIAAIRPSLEPK